MPCLNILTNVSLDGVDTSAILSEVTSTVASIIGKPPGYVMIVLKDRYLSHLVELSGRQLVVAGVRRWSQLRHEQETACCNCFNSRVTVVSFQGSILSQIL